MEQNRFNYYDILEVSPHCQQHEITTAYERARLTYSGENPAIYTMFTDIEARELLKLIEEAYSVLGNKTLRNLYDEKMNQTFVQKDDVSFENLKNASKLQSAELPKKSNTLRVAYTKNDDFEQEIVKTETWNGAALKKVREYKSYTIERLSEITKISSYYINAIERGDPSALPATVFVRGYVGQIAKTLGLEEKKVCDTYMKTFKESLGK